MRRTSVSLPTNKVAHDPYEKRARYANHHRNAGILEKVKETMAQARQARWLKAIAVLVAVLFVFFYLSPSSVDIYRGGGGSSGGQTPADSSYGTEKCTKSSSRDKPIVQYVLMIDAGSTGSRIHVYKFNNCGSAPELESEVFEQTEVKEGGSGLSRYGNDPEAAARSLDPLLAVAMKSVPDKLKGCTPIAVKATAGLRLLGAEKSKLILEAVRRHLEQDFPFPVVSDESGVSIMDGTDEAIFAWVTVNYLLGKIGGPDHSETAAVFDLGGGSTQIVFEPTFKGAPHGGMPDKMTDGDHKYELDFGGRKFELYQHSHLGYGLMAAREAIFRTLVDDIYQDNKDSKAWLSDPIVNPCFGANMAKTITVKMGDNHPLGKALDVNMTGPGSAAPAQCRHLAEKILKKDAECKLSPCSFNGVHQPSIAKTFAKEDIYFLSYFADRAASLGMPESFTLREMHDLATVVCGGKSTWGVFTGVKGALEELNGRPEYCLDLNFMMALTHTGYEMPIDREVRVAKKIKGNELGWALGASLPLLAKNSGWTCKITEIH